MLEKLEKISIFEKKGNPDLIVKRTKHVRIYAPDAPCINGDCAKRKKKMQFPFPTKNQKAINSIAIRQLTYK